MIKIFNIVTEEKFLHQIHLEEQFGSSTKLDAARDKKKSCNNVAIGYNYETEEPISETVKSLDIVISDEKADDEDSDIDLGKVIFYNCYILYNILYNININLIFLFRYLCRCISNRALTST